MNTYELIAEKDGESAVIRFEDVNDAEAMLAGIAHILNKAIESEIWRRGRITLTNLRTNHLVNEMKEKE